MLPAKGPKVVWLSVALDIGPLGAIALHPRDCAAVKAVWGLEFGSSVVRSFLWRRCRSRTHRLSGTWFAIRQGRTERFAFAQGTTLQRGTRTLPRAHGRFKIMT